MYLQLFRVFFISKTSREREGRDLKNENINLRDTVNQLQQSLKETLDECQQLEEEIHNHEVSGVTDPFPPCSSFTLKRRELKS